VVGLEAIEQRQDVVCVCADQIAEQRLDFRLVLGS
jgi:hypothetical protein